MEQSIIQRREEIEQELGELLNEHQSDFDLDYIKSIIYNEEENDDMMKIVAIFDRGRPDELENVLDLATDAWNYFPHKLLNGLSPMGMIEKSKKKS